MKGFFIIVCIFCVIITIAYFFRRYNLKKTKKVKKEKPNIDLPFKNIEVKIKRKR